MKNIFTVFFLSACASQVNGNRFHLFSFFSNKFSFLTSLCFCAFSLLPMILKCIQTFPMKHKNLELKQNCLRITTITTSDRCIDWYNKKMLSHPNVYVSFSSIDFVGISFDCSSHLNFINRMDEKCISILWSLTSKEWKCFHGTHCVSSLLLPDQE